MLVCICNVQFCKGHLCSGGAPLSFLKPASANTDLRLLGLHEKVVPGHGRGKVFEFATYMWGPATSLTGA